MTLKYAIKFVADMDRAVAFHRDILKLTLAFQTPDWSEFDTGETRLAQIWGNGAIGQEVSVPCGKFRLAGPIIVLGEQRS